MSGKKQQTFAKLQRERKVKEKRQLKQEKKLAAAARKLAVANGELMPTDSEDEAMSTGTEDGANTDVGTDAAPPE